MRNLFFTHCWPGCEQLSRVWMDWWRRQYEWLHTQQQLGVRMWSAVTPSPLGPSPSAARPEVEDVVEHLFEEDLRHIRLLVAEGRALSEHGAWAGAITKFQRTWPKFTSCKNRSNSSRQANSC